jgi:hypothetical protein
MAVRDVKAFMEILGGYARDLLLQIAVYSRGWLLHFKDVSIT